MNTKTSRGRSVCVGLARTAHTPRTNLLENFPTELHTRRTHTLKFPVFATVLGWASDSESIAEVL